MPIERVRIPYCSEDGSERGFLSGILQINDPKPPAGTNPKRIALVSRPGTHLANVVPDTPSLTDLTWRSRVGLSTQLISGTAISQSRRLRHKDNLYQRQLAERLPIDSCRFDFR